jgi:hypothetical protein
MELQEIQDRNKEIALMLNWKEEQLGSWFHIQNNVNYVVYSEHNNYPHKGLPFHRDWNWLMEAVEFIEKSNKYKVIIGPNDWCTIKTQFLHIKRDFVDVIDVCSSTTKKEAIFLAVSDFAKKFNNNKL